MDTYPVTLTPSEDVTRRKDGMGRAYLRFRTATATRDRTVVRTARVFGEPNVARMLPRLKRGVAVAARVAFEPFKGADGRQGQSMKIVSLD